MRYTYTYRATAWDLWQLSTYYIYDSMAEFRNIILIVTTFALVFSRQDQAQGFMRCPIALGCCFFTAIQPLMTYGKAKKRATGITQGTQVAIDDKGFYIRVGSDMSDSLWKSAKRASRKPTMIIVLSSTTHEFTFTNRVLGNKKEELHRYAASRVESRTRDN